MCSEGVDCVLLRCFEGVECVLFRCFESVACLESVECVLKIFERMFSVLCGLRCCLS